MAPTKKEFPYPEHLQYWPYSEEQYSRTLITFERFKSWKTVIIGIIEFFEKIEYLDNCYSKQYSKLASVLEPSENEYCGSFKNLSPIYTSARKIGVSYSDSSKVIGDIIIQKLNELKNLLAKKSKKYKEEFFEEFAKVSKIRSETLSAINYHQSLTMAKAKSSSLEITDPWVSERALINQLEKMLKDENSYQTRMNHLFEDMENFDQHLVNQLQSIFDEFSSSKNKECNDLKLSLQNISNIMTQLTPDEPFSYFTKKYGVTSSNLWVTPRTIDNFVYKISNIQILREGVVYRQGSYISSNWKPSWLVLTDTGYLHCFNLKNVSKSIIRQYTIHKKGTGEDIFKAGQDTYKNADKVKTNFSVQLRSPKVVAIDSSYNKDNEEQHCISIIVSNSAFNQVSGTEADEGNDESTNNNDSNNAKLKKIKSNKNQIVYQLRADTSEILHDWLNVINLKLLNMPIEAQPSIKSNIHEVKDSSNTLDASINHEVQDSSNTLDVSTNHEVQDSSNTLDANINYDVHDSSNTVEDKTNQEVHDSLNIIEDNTNNEEVHDSVNIEGNTDCEAHDFSNTIEDNINHEIHDSSNTIEDNINHEIHDSLNILEDNNNHEVHDSLNILEESTNHEDEVHDSLNILEDSNNHEVHDSLNILEENINREDEVQDSLNIHEESTNREDEVHDSLNILEDSNNHEVHDSLNILEDSINHEDEVVQDSSDSLDDSTNVEVHDSLNIFEDDNNREVHDSLNILEDGNNYEVHDSLNILEESANREDEVQDSLNILEDSTNHEDEAQDSSDSLDDSTNEEYENSNSNSPYLAPNPFVPNPFATNPFVSNPFTPNLYDEEEEHSIRSSSPVNDNNSNTDIYDSNDDNNSPLNGQIYPPFKSVLTLIEEDNDANEIIEQDESILLQNPTMKSSIASRESIEYYLNKKHAKEDDQELMMDESNFLAKDIITSNVNIGTDITKEIKNYICQNSDMTLNQKIDLN